MVQRVLSGMRPTGKLHLGHWSGALVNWVRLQDQYECFYVIVDYHALTSEYETPQVVRESIPEILLDWLAVGIDPERSVIFVQSHVPEHAELHLLLSMIVPLPWLERVPTYKEMKQQLVEKNLDTYGFLGYPLLQTADIILYKAEIVPVGEDQLPHLELAREIVRRFNHLYGPVFPEPQALLTPVPRVPGTDGRKMSKSFHNAIYLSDPPAVVWEKLRPMVTDPARVRRTDPGNPDVCPVFDLHKVFSPQPDIDFVNVECRRAGIGCIDCKQILFKNLSGFLEPIQARRRDWEARRDDLMGVLHEGAQKARAIAHETLREAQTAVGLITPDEVRPREKRTEDGKVGP